MIRCRKGMTYDIRLCLLVLATEIYPYIGKMKDSYNRLRGMFLYDLHNIDCMFLHQSLEIINLLGYDLLHKSFFQDCVKQYNRKVLVKKHDDLQFKILFMKMIELGLSEEMRNSFHYTKACYVEYVRELTLFSLIKEEIVKMLVLSTQ